MLKRFYSHKIEVKCLYLQLLLLKYLDSHPKNWSWVDSGDVGFLCQMHVVIAIGGKSKFKSKFLQIEVTFNKIGERFTKLAKVAMKWTKFLLFEP